MKKLLLPFFLLGSLAMMVVMLRTGEGLKTKAAPMGIVNLEFAWNETKTSAILQDWAPGSGTDLIATAKNNTYWDFLFLFFYAGFLFLACKKIAAAIKGAVARAGHLVANGALIAGVLDIIENAGMLLTLNNHGSNVIALITTIISIIKWLLALVAVLYVLTGVVVVLMRKKRGHASTG